jgi:dihydroneopterin aldolase
MGTIEFRVIKALKLVHFEGEGSISYEYLISSIMKVNKDPDFDFSFNTFVDFGNARLIASHDGFLQYEDFFKRLQEFTGERKWAIYSSIDETLQNASLAHQLVSRQIEVKVFKDRAQAMAFLNITPEALMD